MGVMIEVPAAALAIDRLTSRLDFVSIGTNDLLQYLYAADRLVSDLASLPDLFDPGILRLIQDVVERTHEAGAWVGVCGEAAGSPPASLALVGLGVDELSMAPASLPEIKALISRTAWTKMRASADAALKAANAAEARKYFTAMVDPGQHSGYF